MHRISPRPCINGSSSYDLIDHTMTVHRGLGDAAHAMRLWQPHGRDYQIGGDYVPDAARGIRWDDPSFDIAWPMSPLVISDRDRNYEDYRL